jgi:hypothetical protein
MPNIIEQQDLLKGLPDTRLAMLLQNPMGDIPPFLVAAEAQRRQAIRQQFAGSEGKESVVDTLTKQLANVPQNIPAPTRSPPMVPQTPQMQGVAALQAQQAVQQMAQPQEGQMMRSGGMVQRYQAQGFVQPIQTRLKAISDQFGVTIGEAAEMLKNNPSIGSQISESDIGKPPPRPTVESLASSVTGNNATGNFDVFPPAVVNPEMYNGGSGSDLGLPDIPVGPNSPEARRSREEQLRLKKQYLEYAASQTPPEPGETPDEYRARLEKILAVQEPSNSEKAGKYYDMAAAFLDPSKTTMESIAAAGQAFSRASAEQARAEREARIGLERGLLEYDIGKAEDARRKAESDLEAKAAFRKEASDIATRRLDDLQRRQQNIDNRINEVKLEVMKNAIDETTAESIIKKLQEQYDAIGVEMSSYNSLLREQYGFRNAEEYDPNKTSLYPPRT